MTSTHARDMENFVSYHRARAAVSSVRDCRTDRTEQQQEKGMVAFQQVSH